MPQGNDEPIARLGRADRARDTALGLGLSLDDLLLGEGTTRAAERRQAGSEAARLVAAMPDDVRPLIMALLRAGAAAMPKRRGQRGH
jgi:hypothetical protein